MKERLESKILAMLLSCYSVAKMSIAQCRMDVAMAQYGLNASEIASQRDLQRGTWNALRSNELRLSSGGLLFP
jgi:hypothetical protein